MKAITLLVLMAACASWTPDGAKLRDERVADPALTTGGEIRGEMRDSRGEAMPGVTVVAASPALGGKETVELTDENGKYKLGPLPPGKYSITFYFNESSYVHDGVDVRIGEAVVERVTGWRHSPPYR